LKRRRETTLKLKPLSSKVSNFPPAFLLHRHLFANIPSCNSNSNFTLDEEEFITNWDEVVESFDDMGLKEGVLRGIYGHGFVKPSPIQQKGILPVIQGKDTIAQVSY